MKRGIVLFLVSPIIVIGILIGCSERNHETEGLEGLPVPVEGRSITVSAASSLKDAMNAIQAAYVKHNPELNIIINMGSSGQLQQQIEQGAPVDIFISAAQRQMNALADKGFIVTDSRVNLVRNEIVVIAHKDANMVTSFEDLASPQVRFIGIGNPESVPAGSYAKEALETMELWDSLKDKLVHTLNVRQVLSYIELGNADAGIVYHSDALLSERIKVVAVAPETSHSPILYPAALIQSSRNNQHASQFLEFLQSDEAKEIFQQYGFQTVNE
ncbi:molybdate ABC transporter substrate-binding protein [Desulfuribacillus alkaliarsenatis]|uniref:Molybdate ABC transporter substrate-binding protein n=1 Tax=Desulfuribacillus alkaliarsenatis TaxID=766136 RepID=A0A1E5FZG6_9FIRM|nr:molybdate ABC transporter substrate-binding protein [Desulfuribacillus alkaliarsenatis]